VDESNNRINFQHAPESNFSHYDTIDTVDINADGFVDLLLYRGFNSPDTANNTRILLNDGKGQFKEANYPVGIPKGLLIPIDSLKGEYVIVADAGNQFGQKNYQFSVDHASFDWASGLDFFSGKAVALLDLKSDIPGRWLHGTNDSNRLTLDFGSEKAFGYAGNDLLTGLAGDDFIDGGVGVDTAIYRSNRNDYLVRWDNNGNLLVEDKRSITQSSNQALSDGKDQLVSIERINFVDKSIAFDMSSSAGTTAKILGAIFGKESLSNKNYVGIGLSFLDTGWTYDNLASLALDAAGAKTNDQIVTLLWTNVIGTQPSISDKAPYIALLQNGMTPGTLAQLAADSSFNIMNINLVGLAQTGIEYIPVS
jgi:Ca2+-binding RTX toxin-like protein